jgi:hypothetical protein
MDLSIAIALIYNNSQIINGTLLLKNHLTQLIRKVYRMTRPRMWWSYIYQYLKTMHYPRHVLGILLWLLIGLLPWAIHSRWGHVGCGILFHIALKMSVLWGALWDWWGRTLRDCYFSLDWFFFSSGIHWALIPYCIFLLYFCSYNWRRWAGSALILVWCRPSTYRRIVTDLM